MKHIEIIGASPVEMTFFCDVTKLLTKHFGKGLLIPTSRMELLRQAASVLEQIGLECQANKTKEQ